MVDAHSFQDLSLAEAAAEEDALTWASTVSANSNIWVRCQTSIVVSANLHAIHTSGGSAAKRQASSPNLRRTPSTVGARARTAVSSSLGWNLRWANSRIKLARWCSASASALLRGSARCFLNTHTFPLGASEQPVVPRVVA